MKWIIISLFLLLLIPLVSADSYNYTVAVGSDDKYHWSDSDGGSGTIDDTTTLLNEDNWEFSPRVMSYSEININTSAIPDDDVISSAKFYFYIDSYTATRGTARTFYVSIEGDTVVMGSTHVSNGWYSFDIPSGSLSKINKTGKTKFYIGVTEIAPGGTTFRTMYVRAYEYTGDFTSYLTVTHAPVIIEEPPEPDYNWAISVLMGIFGAGISILLVSRMFDFETHLIFRVFLIASGFFWLLIGLNSTIVIASLYSTDVSTIVQTGYHIWVWVIWISIAALSLGILMFALKQLRKSGE